MEKEKKLYSRYSKEVKLEAIRRVLEEEEPVQQVIEDLGIRHRDNVYEWIKKYKSQGVAAFDRKILGSSTECEILQLRAEVAALRKYIEIVVQGEEEKYQAVDELKDAYPLEMLCKALNISVSGYMQYKKLHNPVSPDFYLHR
ncbi:Transposase [Oceanobacillus limi]|uniref:Transposase n=1 Tax=Oceanobacillus limi TaxID=930131 RepID=A0A1I0E0U4_9BACI|nr:transposase [Oceanobacillus limi]SET38642.1 Transposase [Oceanobacillus limi]